MGVARVLVLVVLASIAGPSAARAQDATRARALFDRGVEHAAAEEWPEALAAFRESRAIVERPSTVYNIGTTLHRLGRYREAIATLDDYLRISDATRDAAQRARATELRATLEAGLAHLTLTIDPPSARVAIDGRDAPGGGALRDLALDPGDHVVVVSAEGRIDDGLERSFAPGERVAREVTLAVAAVASTPIGIPEQPRDPVAPDVPPSRSIAEEPALWIVIGGVLLAGAAVTVGVVLATQGTPAPYEGSAGFTVHAVRF